MLRDYAKILPPLLLLVSLLLAPLQGATIDMLILFDRTAVDFLRSQGKSPEEAARMAIAELKMVLNNSGLEDKVKVRLVHHDTVDYQSASGTNGENIGEDLERLTNGRIPGAEELRNHYHADLVTMLVAYPVTGPCIAGVSRALLQGESSPSENCFATIVHVGTLWTPSYTYAHEIGHSFGCGHSDEHPHQTGPQYHPYSAGYYNKSFTYYGRPGLVGTLMCYDYIPGFSGAVRCEPVLSSSSRRYDCPGSPFHNMCIGDAHHDNTRTCRQNANKVAAYRSPRGGSSPEGARPGGSGDAPSKDDVIGLILFLAAGGFLWFIISQIKKQGNMRNPQNAPKVSNPWADEQLPLPPPTGDCQSAPDELPPPPPVDLAPPPARTMPPQESPQILLLTGTLSTGVHAVYRIPQAELARTPHYSIGRSRKNKLCIQDNTVSSEHAELRLRDSILYLVDLGSTNGTSVNGQVLGRKECLKLHFGDHITFGSTSFCLEQSNQA